MGRSIRARIADDLTAAIKRRDTETVAVLRTTLGAIGNAEAVPLATSRSWPVVGPIEVARRQLSEDDVARVIGSEVEEMETAAGLYREGGQHALADRLHAGARLLAGYLTLEP
jgi:hypothetical protein